MLLECAGMLGTNATGALQGKETFLVQDDGHSSREAACDAYIAVLSHFEGWLGCHFKGTRRPVYGLAPGLV